MHGKGEVEQAGFEITGLLLPALRLSDWKGKTVGDSCITSPSWRCTLEMIKPSMSRLDLSFGRTSSGTVGTCCQPVPTGWWVGRDSGAL